MAGTIAITERQKMYDREKRWVGERLIIDFTADASDGSVPTLSLPDIHGFLSQLITDPGATAPTDNWDIKLYHPETDDATFDVLNDAGLDRDTSNTEITAPVLSGATLPIFVNGTYTLAVSGNSVNSATAKIIIEILFP